MVWHLSHRFDKEALPMADRHYNRQKPGTPQFVPPGRCLVLKGEGSLWVSSWQQYVMHDWPGAWMCTCYRRESGELASSAILDAVAATRWHWGNPPTAGMVTFINPRIVPGYWRRGELSWGYCYERAGFEFSGWTKGGLMARRLAPSKMPPPQSPIGAQEDLFGGFECLVTATES